MFRLYDVPTLVLCLVTIECEELYVEERQEDTNGQARKGELNSISRGGQNEAEDVRNCIELARAKVERAVH